MSSSAILEGIRSATSAGKNFVQAAIHNTTETVLGYYEMGGRSITDLTNSYLPAIPAKIVQGLYWTGPAMIAYLSIPRFWCDWTKLIAVLQPTVLFLNDAIGHENSCRFYAAVRNVCLIHAAVDGIALMTTGNMWTIVSLVQNLSTALFAHIETGRPKPLEKS